MKRCTLPKLAETPAHACVGRHRPGVGQSHAGDSRADANTALPCDTWLGVFGKGRAFLEILRHVDIRSRLFLRSPGQNGPHNCNLIGNEVEEGGHRRRTPPIGVDQDAPASCELGDELNKAHQLRLRIAKGDRHRHDGYTRLGNGDKAKHAGDTGGNGRARCHLLQPLGGPVRGNGTIEADRSMMRKVGGGPWPAVAVDVGLARVDRP